MKSNTVQVRLFLILLLSMLVAGCTLDFALPVNEPIRLSVYKSGHPIYEREIDTNDPARQTIQKWLATNPDGWEYAFMTRAPQIYVAGKDFSINISKNEVSVKYCRSFFNCHFWVKKSDALYVEMQKNISQIR